jgi:cation:H+ antiporter
LLTVALFLDSTLTRVDGFGLLISLVVVIIWLVRLALRSSASDPLQADFDAEIPKDMKSRVAASWLLIGICTLLFGADLLVNGAIEIARTVGVSEVVIGVTLVALATSLPELAVSLVSVIRGEYGLAIGNIVGSNIFNLLAVIGVAAAIQPAVLPPSILSTHIFVMVAFTLILFAMTYEYDGRGTISRFKGFLLVTAYTAFTTYVVVQNVRIPV